MLTGSNDQDRGPAVAEISGIELKGLMAQVIQQIGDADRRNGELLRQMQDRLAALSGEARAARPRVPNEYLPGFDRIEDGMSLLAHRIAETYAARNAGFAAVNLSAGVATQATNIAPHAAAHVQSTGAPAAYQSEPSALVQPNALRSSVAGQMRPRAGSYSADVDTFDVVESLPGNPAEPWSPDQAAALSRLYTSREALFSDPAELTVEPAPAYVPSVSHAMGLPAASPVVAADPNNLERRLADIATRIEASLAAARPDSALMSMDHRLDAFESRMAVALKGVTSTSGDQGLRAIEAQIEDLRVQFEQAQFELARLDGLERQLRGVVQQVSDERLSALFKQTMPASVPVATPARPEADFHSVAIAAAEAAAARVATANRDDRTGHVHTLLTEFIQERRQGDEQTAHTLDTLQQAMLRMLDRVEAMDHASGYEPHGAYEAEPVRSAPPHLVPAQETHFAYDEPAEEAVQAPKDYLAEQRTKMQASVQRAASAQREKAQQAEAALAGKPARGGKPQLPAKTGAKRLMVSSIALLAVVGSLSAGALLMAMPRSDVSVTAAPEIQPVKTPVVGVPDSRPRTLNAPASEAQVPAAPAGASQMARKDAPNTSVDPRLVPETVTDDFGQPDNVREVDRVPESQVRSNMAKSQYTTPAPVTGILLQKSATADQASQTPQNAGSDAATAAVPVAARPDDLPGEAPASTGAGQPRGALELPPATVGPLSLRLAAANGDASAEFEVASRLAEGKGTDQNLKEAVRWYQRSATQGFAQAQYRLGTFYERGLGLKADFGRARTWYQRAADQGNVKAMHNLAVLAAGRSAESPDYATAARWFTQAASYGLADSQFNLAVLTESGLGVEKDMVQAAMWFTVAARSGDKEAVRRRDLMKSKMDTAGLAAADHLAKTWQAMVPEKLANDPRFAGEAWKARQAVAPDNG